MRPALRLRPICAALLLSGLSATHAAGTAFTYQGLLEDSGTPAASYDFEALLFDTACAADPCGGNLVTLMTPQASNVVLENGRFTFEMDFGDVFTGPERFLELRVRRSGAPSFTTLLPRQRLAATPYAQHASDADFAAQVAASSVSATELANGAVTVAKIDTASVQSRVSGVCAAGSAMNAINANGSVGCETFPVAPTNFWSRGGNAGTVAGTDFLGTTDATALEFRTEGRASLRLFPVATGSTTNVVAGSPENAVVSLARGGTISGGGAASADPDVSVGAAGAPNQVFSHYATVAGGLGNQAGLLDPDPILGAGAVVGGGVVNAATGQSSTIGGGVGNTASGVRASIGGGRQNSVSGSHGTISGGETNSAGQNAVVGGGSSNTASGGNATIGGGASNIANQLTATIAGGVGNQAIAQSSTIAGGSSNVASGNFSSVGGGNLNEATANSSTVGGGLTNVASAVAGVVSGGDRNTARGTSSVVPGGQFNCAGGNLSFAAGLRAKVRVGTPVLALGTGCTGVASSGDAGGDAGTFVWADSQAADLVSTNDNQFLVRAQNGIWFGTNSTPSIPAGQFISTSTGGHLTTGGAWTNSSDRTRKDGLQSVDVTDVLARVVAMPVYTWHYKAEDANRRHLGPMAQDFHAAFGLNGSNDTSITTVDADGVALAAIQGLNQRLEAEVDLLRSELSELRAQLRELRAARNQK